MTAFSAAASRVRSRKEDTGIHTTIRKVCHRCLPRLRDELAFLPTIGTITVTAVAVYLEVIILIVV
jgi:hypothetical protein